MAITTDTKLLLRAQAPAGATEVVDSGVTGHLDTIVSTAQLTTAQKKLGKASLLLNGTSDTVTFPDSADWTFGTDAFTIEGFARFDDNGNIEVLFSQWSASGTEWYFSKDSANKLKLYCDVGSEVRCNYISTSAIPSFATGTWFHLAVVRSASTCYMFVDGVSIAVTETTAFHGSGLSDITSPLYIGSHHNFDSWFDGHIDEVRISKGVARWTANFTPPTSPYTSDANTVLLLHFNLLDVSFQNHIASYEGDAVTIVSSKKFAPASLDFDGTGDYISVPNSANFDIGTNWTLDFFTSMDTHAGENVFISYFEDTNNYWVIFNSHGVGMTFAIDGGTGTDISLTGATGEIEDTSWYHIAVIKTDSAFSLYLDGTRVATTDTDSTTTTFASGVLRVGDDRDWAFLDGKVDELRITQANPFGPASLESITVPTAAHTAITGGTQAATIG